MSYKAAFRPFELLLGDGRWERPADGFGPGHAFSGLDPSRVDTCQDAASS